MSGTTDKKPEATNGPTKSPVHRSPNYPAFTLDEAIKKARILWDKDHRVGAHRDIILKHLGYNTESGTALRTLATLKRFDLTTEKEGRILVSQRALDILLYPQTDPRHIEALKHSALAPTIYNELYSKYKLAFPSDETLKAELIREYLFNPKQVDSFLTDFRETIKYAGLDRPGSHEEQIDQGELVNKDGSISGTAVTRQQPASGSGTGVVNTQTSYSVPLKKKNEATLSFKKFPLEKADLDLIKRWLELMEENLTEQPVEDGSDLI